MKTTFKKNSNTKSRTYMYVDVILTFNSENAYGDTQEFFDLNIPVNSREKNTVDFLDKKLFKRIAKKCSELHREVGELTKISTCSDWSVFEKKTGLPALPSFGHSCKWFFGNGRTDLDVWELSLISRYGFGKSVDMSWIESLRNESQVLVLDHSAEGYAPETTQQEPLTNCLTV
jgi:hypothetical protein